MYKRYFFNLYLLRVIFDESNVPFFSSIKLSSHSQSWKLPRTSTVKGLAQGHLSSADEGATGSAFFTIPTEIVKKQNLPLGLN